MSTATATATAIVIAAGGTAGHVYPGLALAAALKAARPDASISFVGTTRGIETSAVPAAGFGLHLIDVVPWAKTLGARRYLAAPSLVRASVQSRRILARERAAGVVGMGGYASLPVVLAARCARLPVVLHEQNAVPGIANVVAARCTSHVGLVFEEARRYFRRAADVRVVGNPLRAAFALLDRAALRDEARAALGLKPDVATIGIFGGSLGAARLNEAATGIAAAWRDRVDRQLLVLAGRANAERVRAAIPSAAPAQVLDYLGRMDHFYAAADLVVSRAGAAAVSEIAAAAAPSVLVPYPYARRNHQRENARALERVGAAVIVSDADASPSRLAALADELLGDRERLARMGAAARAVAKPHAAEDLAAWVLDVVEARR